MDALALVLLWLALVVPVAITAFRRRRDPVAEFSRALESLRPHALLLVPDHRAAKIERRRRVLLALAALAVLALVVAALSRARLALGAGILLVDLGLAYVAATVANDRRRMRL